MTISIQVFIIACFVCLLIGSAITLAVGAVMTRREPLQELPNMDKPIERPDTSNYCECDMHGICKTCTRKNLQRGLIS